MPRYAAKDLLPPIAPVRTAALVWALAWLVIAVLGDRIDLGNKALILVLASAVSALWWGPWASLATSAAAVLAFNFFFVPPRLTLSVGIRQHAVLLFTTLSVGWIVALLMARLRRAAVDAGQHALRSDQLRRLGEALREVEDPGTQAPLLCEALANLSGRDAALLLANPCDPRTADPPAQWLLGTTTVAEKSLLERCARQGRAPDHDDTPTGAEPAWALPLRGRGASHGAALMRLAPGAQTTPALRRHAQALCDQLGAALERAAAVRTARTAQAQAQSQALRNTLLAAIAHDHRTPLATILGAAGSLHDQAERLSPPQRLRLAATIVDEAAQLSRLTENSLQLARLDAVGLDLLRDWESVEEIVGTVLRRVRQRHPGQGLRAQVDPGLPLLRCDAVLMVQLLDNLVDNALKYGGDPAAVEVAACLQGGRVVIAVRDRGPGVAAEQRERIFETFQRGVSGNTARRTDSPGRRGAGIGLALCKAIARAHHGELRLRQRHRGGCSFELALPVEPAPEVTAPPEADPGST